MYMNKSKLFKSTLIALAFVLVLGIVYLIRPSFLFKTSVPMISNDHVVSENGVAFSYPTGLFDQSHGPVASSSHYVSHLITNSENWYMNRSEIRVLIPLAEANGETAPLSDRLLDFPKEDTDRYPKIEKININGHLGEKLTIDSSLYGDGSLIDGQKHNVSTSIQFESKYADSYIVLTYIRYEGDATLDGAWQMILNTLNY
jgi:hypothetical protein